MRSLLVCPLLVRVRGRVPRARVRGGAIRPWRLGAPRCRHGRTSLRTTGPSIRPRASRRRFRGAVRYRDQGRRPGRGDDRRGGRGCVARRHRARGGLRTSYSFLATVTVHRGRGVAAGEVLGTAGGTGPNHAPGVVHFGLRAGDEYVDPMLLFGAVDLTQVVHLAPTAAPFGYTATQERHGLLDGLVDGVGDRAAAVGRTVSGAAGAVGTAAAGATDPRGRSRRRGARRGARRRTQGSRSGGASSPISTSAGRVTLRHPTPTATVVPAIA